MPAPYGLVPSGFSMKTIDAIVADVNANLLAGISTSLDVQPTSPIGVFNGIYGAGVAEAWQVLAALYNGMDADQSANDQLVSLALLTGTQRLPATQTQVLGCTVNLSSSFVTTAPGTMFASISGNPTALFTNKATVSYTGGGGATNETFDFQAVNTGPIQCLAGTLTVIAQPLTGWNSITNPTSGIAGSVIETDPLLRIRREQELSQAGAGTAAAIQSAVLAQLVTSSATPTTSNTLGCTVLWNDTDFTDANGLPPHSIEVIAYQPGNTSNDDQLLANLIAAQKTAGTGTRGNSSKVVTDSQGITEQIFFTRPTTLPIYCSLTTVVNASLFPANGLTLVGNAIKAYAVAAWLPGVAVYALHTQAQAFGGQDLGSGDLTARIPGLLDVTNFKIDTANPPLASANITVGVRQIATLVANNPVVS